MKRLLLPLLLLAASLPAGATVPKPATPPASPAAPPTTRPPAPRMPSLIGLSAWGGGVSPKEASTDWVSGVELFWADGEPRPGEFDWTRFDAKILAVDAAGASPVAVLVPVSPWGTPPLPPSSRPIGGAPDPLQPPSDPKAWAAFVTKVVERYDADGLDDCPGLKSPVRAWQLMPNLSSGWRATAIATTEYLDATAAAVRAANSRVALVLGSLNDAEVDLLAVHSGAVEVMIIGGMRTTKGVIRGVPEMLEKAMFLEEVLLQAKDSYQIVDIHHFTSSGSAGDRIRFLSEYVVNKEIGRKTIWSLHNALPTVREAMPDVESVASEMLRTVYPAILAGCRRFAWPADASVLGPNEVLAPYPLVGKSGKNTPVWNAFTDLGKRFDGLVTMKAWRHPGDAPNAEVFGVDTTSVPNYTVIWNSTNAAGTATFPAKGTVEVKNAVTGETKSFRAKDGKVTIPIGPYPSYLTGVSEPVGNEAEAPAAAPPKK